MWQRFTERARKIVYYAQEEALKCGEGHVSTEHLLLGLLREPDNVAGRLFETMGVSGEIIRAEIEGQLPRSDSAPRPDMSLAPPARRVIDLAYHEARKLKNDYIGTEHLLLGLIMEEAGLAARVLHKMGLTADRTRAEVVKLQARERTGADAAAKPTVDPAAPAQIEGYAGVVLPMLLTFAKVYEPDLQAFLLLANPTERVTAAVQGIGQAPASLAHTLARWMFTRGSRASYELPSLADTLDAGTSSFKALGRIANYPGSLLHQALLDQGVTAQAVAAAFLD